MLLASQFHEAAAACRRALVIVPNYACDVSGYNIVETRLLRPECWDEKRGGICGISLRKSDFSMNSALTTVHKPIEM